MGQHWSIVPHYHLGRQLGDGKYTKVFSSIKTTQMKPWPMIFLHIENIPSCENSIPSGNRDRRSGSTPYSTQPSNSRARASRLKPKSLRASLSLLTSARQYHFRYLLLKIKCDAVSRSLKTITKTGVGRAYVKSHQDTKDLGHGRPFSVPKWQKSDQHVAGQVANNAIAAVPKNHDLG